MPRRKIEFENDELYHIYNRGVDKRELFNDEKDIARFMQSIIEFNTTKPIGSIYENSFISKLGVPNAKSVSVFAEKTQEKPLVEFIAYCINPNHYHFILKQITDGGISKFIQKFSQGYTMYFNGKHKRVGPLFGGCFKSKHIDTDDYLLHLSAYVNLNFSVHKIKLGAPNAKFVRSSWKQYSEEKIGTPLIPCDTELVLGQFKNKQEYKEYAEETLGDILERRENESEETAEGLLE